MRHLTAHCDLVKRNGCCKQEDITHVSKSLISAGVAAYSWSSLPVMGVYILFDLLCGHDNLIKYQVTGLFVMLHAAAKAMHNQAMQ